MAAMKRYPRSFLQLVTLGHVLVALPLIVVTVYVFVALDTLGEQYRDAVRNGSISSRLISDITEDLQHMERDLRRFEVLRDADSLGDYAQVRGEWRANVQSFIRLPPLPGKIVEELKAQMELENLAFVALTDSGNSQSQRSVIDEIRLRTAKVLDESRTILERDQEEFLSESNALRKRLLVAAVSAVLVALGVLWLIRRLLSRLINRFERAVLRLGNGDLQQSIALDGPGDLRWLGRWLEWLRRRLLSLEEGRTQVLRHVSHELKTPLAAMNEGASLLAEGVPGPLTHEQGRIVGILQNNSRRLQGLIEGLLRLQQAGHAAERIGYETLRFDILIEQVLETHRLIAGERRVSFECSLMETKIIAGREALVTIIHNLLSNAVKFSPDGACVKIKLRRNARQAALDVYDQGAGVKKGDAEHIFEPFFRSSASREVAGVGLGLAIAREFVLAHRGELKLVPSAAGAHFRVLLPLDAPYLRVQKNV
jgi:two-component system, NtrC family, sensor histidine kinase GlrK